MNIWFVAILAAAAHATTPFPWEFDLKRCGRVTGGYDCFVPIDGKLTRLDWADPFKNHDHSHVIAINAQATEQPDRERFNIIMQSRSSKQKVDVNIGMILSRMPENGIEEKFLECRVVNGKVVLSSAAYLQADFIDWYFDEHHLYCDFAMYTVQSPTKISQIVSEMDTFALSMSMDGLVQKYVEKDGDHLARSGWKHEYIAARLTHIDETVDKHRCNVSQVIHNPKYDPEGGKVRDIEIFSNSLGCPDDRYIIHARDAGKGRRFTNAKIEYKNGQYEISDPEYMRAGWTVEKGGTLNAFCHVKDRYLCPLSIPCDGLRCPYITFNNTRMEYNVECEKRNDILVIEKNLHTDRHANQYHRNYNSSLTALTKAYCADYDSFFLCAEKNLLCNGKSCSIVQSPKLFWYDVKCTNPNHVFQDFSETLKRWIYRITELVCTRDGEWMGNDREWMRMTKYARCKDPADTTAPVDE